MTLPRHRSQRLGHACLTLLLTVFSVGVALFFVSRATLQSSDPPPPLPIDKRAKSVPGEILVRFRSESVAAKDRSRRELIVDAVGPRISIQLESLSEGAEIVFGLRLARVAPKDTAAAIEALRARADVLYAEPNFMRYTAGVPNDPRYSEQWALKNSGQNGGTVGADIKAEPAWDIIKGSRNMVVGVVDQGVDINHPDLKDNIWTNLGEIPGNGIDDDGNGYIDDVNGWDFVHNDNTVFDGNGTYPVDRTDEHGTHVAGTIGATGNNGVGVVGVNWQVSLMSLKFLGPNGGFTTDLLKTLAYAKMMRDLWTSSNGTRGANIRVLNNSYGGGGKSQAEIDAINALAQSDILFVVAAGNSGLNNDRFPQYPANYNLPNLISVAATDRNDNRSGFSDYGALTVHLAAPGSSILSTTPNSTYSNLSGTSMATPHVAGAAAMLLAASPNASAARVRAALLFGGDQLANLGNSTSLQVASGRRLNLLGSLQNMADGDATPPAAVANFQVISQSGRTVTLSWTAPGDDANGGRASMYELRYVDGDVTDLVQFASAYRFTTLLPAAAGTVESVTVNIPLRHIAGSIGIRAIDNVGNAGPISVVNVSVPLAIADPFQISTGPAEALSTGGTPLGVIGDDKYAAPYLLPAAFKFLGARPSIALSTNGALYFNSEGLTGGSDAASHADWLNAGAMLAAAWDDLRTDRRPGDDIYVVQPDPSRIIFRWQAVTTDHSITSSANRGETPVNFEVEFKQDGTIIIRYGDGNRNLFPVVGLSTGEPDAYAVPSHTSESAPLDLSNAPTVIFTPRVQYPRPAPDLRLTMTTTPEVAQTTRQFTYSIQPLNGSFQTPADQSLIVDELPPGTTFVSCSTTFTSQPITCSGPPVGSGGTVLANVGNLIDYSPVIKIVVQVTAPPGTVLTNTATVSSYWSDPNLANNSTTVSTDVLQITDFSNAMAISAGGDNNRSFTTALKADGTVWCWGENSSGRLGNGSLANSDVPIQVVGLNDVVAISAGIAHVLALKSDGTVWAWGSNFLGQLGTGNRNDSSTPVQVSSLNSVVSVSAWNSSLALKSDGTVWNWGLADANNQLIMVPAQVSGLDQITGISLGSNHSLAVRGDGTVWAWGDNFVGQCGQLTSTTSIPTPTKVAGLAGIKSVTAGGGFSLAVALNGNSYGWGYNGYGNLGTAVAGGPTPALVHLSGVKAIEAGYKSTIALKSDGTVWTWGDNSSGQLGRVPSPGNPVDLPGQVTGLSNAAAVTTCFWHSGAVMADGTVRTWGINQNGELGDGTNVNQQAPTIVSGLTRVTLSITPNSGSYFGVQYARIAASTPGATIRYTIDGPVPTLNDPVFPPSGFIRLDRNMNLAVKAWKTGMLPALAQYSYSISVIPNQIDDPSKFVRQQYLDFLGREPDQGGWDYWTAQITQCGGDWLCTHNKRIDVSAAFFVELEFQRTGYVVYRLYRAAYGTLPSGPSRANVTFAQFIADRAQLVDGPGLSQSTITLANSFVGRPDFKTAYPDAMSPAEFVDKLFDSASLTSAANTSLRQQQIDAMTNNGKTRAQVLLDVIEIQELKDREYNPAFVLMQYFGYLRRNPEQGGYDFWLNVLNNREPNNFRGMVCAFLTAVEYQQRFGTSVTRTNGDCGQ